MAGDRVLTVKLAGDSKGAVGAISKVEGKSQGLGKKILKIGGALAGINIGKNIALDIAKVGGEYQKTMNILQSTTRATDSQMEKVRATARELGSDMTIPATSASQATGAMLELAKGGLSLNEAMDATKGTLLLAAAAQVDGARAAEIQAGALAQFTLKAKDAGMVADTLANVSDAAAGGIEEVALALSYAGPVANSLSMSIQETSSAIGLLHKNSIMGSKAGTALRAILASLANPSEKAAGALEELGIEAFDAQGNFVGMRKITQQLTAAKGRLTEQEFAAAGAAAFGREPLAAINALASEGAKGWDGMAKAVAREGSAADVAAAKNEGFGGAVDGLQSQLEDLYITIWEKVSPGLTKITEKAGEALGWFNDLANGGGNLDGALNDFDGAAFGKKLADGIGKAIDSITGMAGKIGDKIGSFFGKVDWVGLGIELGKSAVPLLAGLALGILNFDLGALLSGLADHWQEVLLGILTIAFMPAKWALKIANALRKIPFVGKFLGWIVEGINKIGGKVLKAAGNILKMFTRGFRDAMGWAGPTMISRLIGWFKNMRKKIIEWGKTLAGNMGLWAKSMAYRFGSWLAKHGPVQAWNALMKLKSKIFNFFAPAVKWLVGFGGKILGGLINGVKAHISFVLGVLRWVKDKLLGFFATPAKWLYNAGRSILSGLVDGIKSKIGDVVGAVKGAVDAARAYLPFSPAKKGPFSGKGWTLYSGRSITDSLAEGIGDRVRAVKSAARSLASAAQPDVSGLKVPEAARNGGRAHARPFRGDMGRRGFLRGSNGGQTVIVRIDVQGNVIGERDFAKRITPVVRDTLVKIGNRNGGLIFD